VLKMDPTDAAGVLEAWKVVDISDTRKRLD
jgi:hypothetical protein